MDDAVPLPLAVRVPPTSSVKAIEDEDVIVWFNEFDVLPVASEPVADRVMVEEYEIYVTLDVRASPRAFGFTPVEDVVPDVVSDPSNVVCAATAVGSSHARNVCLALILALFTRSYKIKLQVG